MKIFFGCLLAIISGILYTSGFPNHLLQLGPVGVAASIFILFYLFGIYSSVDEEEKRRWPFLVLFLLAVNLSGYYWIPYTLEQFGGIPIPLNYLLSTAFALIILPQYILFLSVLWFFKKRKWQVPRPIFLAGVLVLLENIIPQQFPTHLGHSWLPLAPYLPFAKWFGVPFYSLLTYWPVCSLLQLVGHQNEKEAKKELILPFAFLGISLLISVALPLRFHPQGQLNLRLVQANIGNNLKIDAEKFEGTAANSVQELYTQLSLQDQVKADLIIWPETAYPRLLSTEAMKENIFSIPPSIQTTVANSQAALFTGGYDYSTNGDDNNYFENQYNTAFLFKLKNEQVALDDYYYKRELIPFGETLPFGPLNKKIGPLIKNISFFARGDRFPLFSIGQYHFISAICYEVLFPNFIRQYLNSLTTDPDFLINISNDSWYGDTIEPYQHLYLTHWRALENALPIVRMTNTGISSILYPDGSESKRSQTMKRMILDLPLHLSERQPTLYQRLGILGTIILWLLLFAGDKAFFQKIVKTKES